MCLHTCKHYSIVARRNEKVARQGKEVARSGGKLAYKSENFAHQTEKSLINLRGFSMILSFVRQWTKMFTQRAYLHYIKIHSAYNDWTVPPRYLPVALFHFQG